jgi:hypothetical protein
MFPYVINNLTFCGTVYEMNLLPLSDVSFGQARCFLNFRNVGITVESWTILNIVALLELATLLLGTSMQNFPLALLSAVLYIPPSLWIVPTRSR